MTEASASVGLLVAMALKQGPSSFKTSFGWLRSQWVKYNSSPVSSYPEPSVKLLCIQCILEMWGKPKLDCSNKMKL